MKKLKTRCYWTIANNHGDLWHFYHNGPMHHKLWQRKTDIPKPLRSDVRLVRIEVRERPVKRRRVNKTIDNLIGEYIGNRMRFRRAKQAVLARVRKNR